MIRKKILNRLLLRFHYFRNSSKAVDRKRFYTEEILNCDVSERSIKECTWEHYSKCSSGKDVFISCLQLKGFIYIYITHQHSSMERKEIKFFSFHTICFLSRKKITRKITTCNFIQKLLMGNPCTEIAQNVLGYFSILYPVTLLSYKMLLSLAVSTRQDGGVF